MEDRRKQSEHDTLLAVMAEKVGNIEKTVTTVSGKLDYTNGKVANVIRWQEQAIGGAKVAGIILLPMLIWGFIVLRDVQKNIQDTVRAELSGKYNFETK